MDEPLFWFIIVVLTIAFGYALLQELFYRLRERERKALYERDRDE